MVGKSIPRFTKFPSLVLIKLVLTEIQAFKNVKYLQRNVWKTGQIRTNVRICPVFHTFTDIYIYILGKPGATSRDDAIFSGES